MLFFEGFQLCLCAVYMYKSMILFNNFSSETSWPISTKVHVDPTVELGLKVCSKVVLHWL